MCAAAAGADEKLVYPNPPTSNQVDDYLGMKVRDPYRPLEDLDAEPTRNSIEAETSSLSITSRKSRNVLSGVKRPKLMDICRAQS
ncbi:MAG TPA: hypothetical protein VE758_09330 [Chthoniobacterales bacterium]|nr:hypothetical protein [Chthoniobacterales bacterium]